MKKFKVQSDEQHEQVATLDLGDGHVITRTHSIDGFFGGHKRMQSVTHLTTYSCSCGETRRFFDRPNSKHLDALEHDTERRMVRDWLDAEHAQRILAKLARKAG